MPNSNGSLLVLQPFLDFCPSFLAELPGVSHTKSVLEHLANLLESESGNLWVEEDDEHPADAADGGVEAEGAGGSHALHHGQKCAGDDDIGTPARTSQPHRAHCANFHWEEIGAHPRRIAD